MAYCNVSDVRAYLGLSAGDDDGLISQFIARAQATIDRRCNRTFESTGAYTSRYYDAVGRHIEGRKLILDRDLCEIETVTNGDGIVIAATDYVTAPRNDTPFYEILLKANSGLVWTYVDDYEGAIEVSGVWAYSITPSNDIVQAAVRLASFYYRQKDAPLQDLDAVGLSVVLRPVSFPGDVEALLRPYIR